jgi:hypothetical protein
MKKLSKKEIDKFGKKKGYKVRRKMGAQKKPEPVVEDIVSLSGDASDSQPAPAPAPVPIEANVQMDTQPFAAMSASIAHSNRNMEKLIERNTEMMEAFKNQLIEQVSQAPKRSSWRHKIKRDAHRMLDEIVSTPFEN